MEELKYYLMDDEFSDVDLDDDEIEEDDDDGFDDDDELDDLEEDLEDDEEDDFVLPEESMPDEWQEE